MKSPIYRFFEKLVDFAFSFEMMFVFFVLACSIYYTLKRDSADKPDAPGQGDKAISLVSNSSSLPANPAAISQGLPRSQNLRTDKPGEGSSDAYETISGSLFKELEKAGFQASESEIISQKVQKYLNNPHTLAINGAIIEATKDLALSSERSQKLEKAVMAAFYETSGGIQLSKWENCLDAKIEARKPDACILKQVEEFRSWMRNEAEGDQIPYGVSKKSFEISHRLTKAIVKDCAGSYEQAIDYLDPAIGHCK